MKYWYIQQHGYTLRIDKNYHFSPQEKKKIQIHRQKLYHTFLDIYKSPKIFCEILRLLDPKLRIPDWQDAG